MANAPRRLGLSLSALSSEVLTAADAPLAVTDVEQLRIDILRAVRRVCPRWLADQAEDLTQIAVSRILDRLRSTKGQLDLSPGYLHRTAYTVVIDEIRRRQRLHEIPLDPDVPVQSSEGNPERQAFSREVREAITSCVRLQVSLDERLKIIDHLAECPTCAEAWKIAAELLPAHEEVEQPQVAAFEPGSAVYSRTALLVAMPILFLVALGIAFIAFRPAVLPREATDSPRTPPSTPAPQAVQQTQNPVAAPAPVRPSPPAPAPPLVVETPAVATAQDQLSKILAGQHAEQAATTATTPPLSPLESDESAIRRVVATYKTALETKDVDLLSSVDPGLSAAEAVRLRASFRHDSHQITITLDDIQVDGTTAMARISRQDVFTESGGQRRSISNRQTLRFEKSATGWVITSIGP